MRWLLAATALGLAACGPDVPDTTTPAPSTNPSLYAQRIGEVDGCVLFSFRDPVGGYSHVLAHCPGPSSVGSVQYCGKGCTHRVETEAR